MNCRPDETPSRRPVTEQRAAPQRGWVCGYAELGRCCANGPTADGRCGRALEIKPSDTTLATTTGATTTGATTTAASDDELPPCIPRRSHWLKRQSTCINLALLTGGLLLLAMSLPSREKNFVPGDLSGKHAQILENTLVSQRCGLCHPGSHADSQTLMNFSGQFKLNDGQQDALCMQCHKGHMPAAAARDPHDLSNEMWQALAARKEASSAGHLVSHVAQSSTSAHKEIAETSCASCHVEHHGRGFNLKAMADDRCQACHRRKFESLSSGHPEFANFPAERPRTITFSHQMHADKHFPQKGRDFDCRRCHLDTTAARGGGQVARSMSFDKACAECHHEPIRAASADGWALLQLPSIDAAAAEEDESGLKHWPQSARFGFEGAVSPVHRALLAADESAQTALAQLPASGQLQDISTLDGARSEIAKSLARATQRLIIDTARDGQTAWRTRLETVTLAKLGRELTASDKRLIEAMCAGLPPDLFRKVDKDWFRQNQTLANRQSRTLENATSASHRSDDHRPLPATLVSTGDDSLLEGDQSSSDSLLLAEPAGDDALIGEAQQTNSDDDLLLDNSSVERALSPDTGEISVAGKSHADSDRDYATPIRGAAHVSAGGWYADDRTLAVRYMPIGHADPTLAAWSLWWSMIGDAAAVAKSQAASTLGHASLQVKSLAQQIPGGCVDCHQLPGRSTDALQLSSESSWSLASAWKIKTRPLAHKEFTKFDHAPHLALPAVNDCRYCHVLPSKALDPSGGGAMQMISVGHHTAGRAHGAEFQKMQLAQCAACHRPNGANAGCLQCHNYHVTSLDWTSPIR